MENIEIHHRKGFIREHLSIGKKENNIFTNTPIEFKYNVLGIFYFLLVRYLYGYSVLKAKSFKPA